MSWGTSSTAGLIPGIIGMALVAVLSIPYIAKYIIKCQERGEGFTEYEGDMHFMNGGGCKNTQVYCCINSTGRSICTV